MSSSPTRYLLALESTCDETAAAVIDDQFNVVASAVASQEELHLAFGGVVPEIAARAHLDRMIPMVDRVLKEAKIDLANLAAIAVATEPGLPGSLLVGLATAKALCLAWNKPLVAVNHIHAHVYACQMGKSESIFPCIGFIVSGGHSNLYRCESSSRWEYLGGTIDDAAGEAFDKVAVMLGLPFPGGPNLAKLADTGDAKAFDFPRPMIHDHQRLDFSFSGLKTAVRYRLVGTGKQDFSELQLDETTKANVAASFQAAVVECLVTKAVLACRTTGVKRLCIGGGVAANRLFRKTIEEQCKKHKIELHIAPHQLCTDNAMMGALAWEKIFRGEYDSLETDIQPGLQRRPKEVNTQHG